MRARHFEIIADANASLEGLGAYLLGRHVQDEAYQTGEQLAGNLVGAVKTYKGNGCFDNGDLAGAIGNARRFLADHTTVPQCPKEIYYPIKKDYIPVSKDKIPVRKRGVE